MKFKSHTNELGYLLSSIIIGGFIIFIGNKFQIIDWYSIYNEYILASSLLIAFTIYMYYGMTNYDITIIGETLKISNRFLFFRKRQHIIYLNKIQQLFLKDSSFINLFSEYKYMIICYTDEINKPKKLKIHCHGLEYDSNGDNYNLPTFDSLYEELNNRNTKINWI
jgi:hypothetical protein